MKLKEFYTAVIETGIENDLRGRDEIQKLLAEEQGKFDKLDDKEKEYFDRDRLFNPFSDTRILHGDAEVEVNKAVIGIDMEVGEVLLTYVLNKDLSPKIDLIIAHHPEGYALVRLFDVMKLQSDLLAACGITLSVAEKLMEKRIGEVERRLMPINHNRTVDVAKLLDLPMICIHTAADNCVTNYLTRLFEKEKPARLKDILQLLKGIPEYQRSAALQLPPRIVSGSEDSRCGKIVVDMTGGTEGAKDVFEKFAAGGVSTLVGMHISEDHLENAKKANLNVVIAGHISSDTLGLNLLLDSVEKKGRLEFVCVSGFERVRRGA
ncbi:MAG: NGG1p interacting factor NIF3 [Candidatus Aminicenantes bacterium RBG_19FT_COMBO_58_17]|jgi:putative NIF3 family GTP cyclohydrolase 1 type 2|nr:MAG: NGG1p interacting factor NIF3 [Candidatus Aminicenantes bacterium RBG_19FT_COMBO_58_17]